MDSKVFMRSLIELLPSCLEVASPVLRADVEVVSAAVAADGEALEWAADELRNDRELVMLALTTSGGALEHASDTLKVSLPRLGGEGGVH